MISKVQKYKKANPEPTVSPVAAKKERGKAIDAPSAAEGAPHSGGSTLIDSEVEKELVKSELENQRELDRAKRKYERMKKKLDKHPHAAMKALATLAAALSLSLNRSPEINV